MRTNRTRSGCANALHRPAYWSMASIPVDRPSALCSSSCPDRPLKRYCCLDDAKILELPRIVVIEVFVEQLSAPGQWRPVAVNADHRTEVGPAEPQDLVERQVVGFDDAHRRVLDRPYDAGHHRG